MDRFVVISGCSGGGKSAVLQELHRRGFSTVEEPGRRIVMDEMKRDGTALPWADAEAFARRAIQTSLADLEVSMHAEGWVFFDRGLVDAAAALERVTGEPALAAVHPSRRYNRQVFLTPPWPEIYLADAQRRHSLNEATHEYIHLLKAYPALGYHLTVLPKTGVAERADMILDALSA